MIKPKDVKDIDIAFGSIEGLLPPYDKIPKEFQHGKNNKWNKVVSQWFFMGLPQGTAFIPKKDIDKNKALRHIKAILSSFEPSTEHKESGCAYLLSLWFEDIKIPTEPLAKVTK